MKKILIVTYYWPPKTGVGVLRWFYFSNILPTYGYEPIIYTPLTSDKNSLDKSLINENIKVIRKSIFDPSAIFSKITGSNINQGAIDNQNNLFDKFYKWVRGKFFVPDSRIFWVNKSVNFLKLFLKKNSIKTIITTGPPHSMHLIGYNLKKLQNINWIADFRDPWSNWDILKEINPSLSSMLKHKKLESMVINLADKIIVTNKNLAKEYSKIIDKKKIETITNGTNLYYNNEKYINKKFKISYLGLMNKLRYPKVFFEILKEVILSNRDIKNDLEIFISGTISNSIIYALKNDDVLAKYLTYIRHVDYKETFNHYNNSSLLLLLLNKNSSNTTPAKVFDYASSGTRILTLGNKKDKNIDKLLNELKIGKKIKYSDRESIKKIILKSYDDYKNKYKIPISENLKNYDRILLAKKLSKILDFYC